LIGAVGVAKVGIDGIEIGTQLIDAHQLSKL
jgi:hypothetical protein